VTAWLDVVTDVFNTTTHRCPMNHGALNSLKRACRIKPTDSVGDADYTLHHADGIFREGTCDLVFFHGEYVDDYKPFVIQVHKFRSLRGYARGPFYVITESRSYGTFCEFTLIRRMQCQRNTRQHPGPRVGYNRYLCGGPIHRGRYSRCAHRFRRLDINM